MPKINADMPEGIAQVARPAERAVSTETLLMLAPCVNSCAHLFAKVVVSHAPTMGQRGGGLG